MIGFPFHKDSTVKHKLRNLFMLSSLVIQSLCSRTWCINLLILHLKPEGFSTKDTMRELWQQLYDQQSNILDHRHKKIMRDYSFKKYLSYDCLCPKCTINYHYHHLLITVHQCSISTRTLLICELYMCKLDFDLMELWHRYYES